MGEHHDSLFRSCFAGIENARSWLRYLLPGFDSVVDWDELRSLPTNGTAASLRQHDKDLLLSAPARGLEAQFLFLPEHKAWRDRDVVDQLLRYAVHIRTE